MCDFLVECTDFRSRVTGNNFVININVHCNSDHVVYLLSCAKCDMQYVGSMSTKFRTSFNNHISRLNAHRRLTPKIRLRMIIAELQHASEAPWVRKIGNPSSQENLVMASAYERTSFVRPYRLWGRGRERGVSRYSSRSPIRETKECYLSLAVFCLEKSKKHSFLFAMSTNDRRD